MDEEKVKPSGEGNNPVTVSDGLAVPDRYLTEFVEAKKHDVAARITYTREDGKRHKVEIVIG